MLRPWPFGRLWSIVLHDGAFDEKIVISPAFVPGLLLALGPVGGFFEALLDSLAKVRKVARRVLLFHAGGS